MSPQALERRTRSFTWSTLAALLALLLLVAALGYVAFARLDAIIHTAAEAGRPLHNEMALVRGLVSALNNAENFAKVYGIAGKDGQLADFTRASEDARIRARMLQTLPPSDSAQGVANQDLARLAIHKLDILQDIAELETAMRTDAVLQSLTDEMYQALRRPIPPAKPKVQPKTADQPTTTSKDRSSKDPKQEKPDHRGNFYRWMLGLPEKPRKSQDKAVETKAGDAAEAKAPTPTTATSTEKPTVLPSTVERSLKELAQAEEDRYRLNLEQDLQLTEQSLRTTDSIDQLVMAMEVQAFKDAEHQAAVVAATAKDANRWILLFCLIFPAFLLLMGVGIVRYVRTIKEHDAAISAAKAEAEALAETRSRFLSTMSHEIRTPMNAVIGFSEQLLSSQLDAEQQSQMEVVHQAAKHLLGIVNTVLDFSRLEAGQMQYAQADFDLPAELDMVCSLMRPQFLAKGLELKLFLPPAGPRWVKGDAMRLRQVFLNLIGNALKFTHQGGLTVSVDIQPKGQGLLLAASLQDTGVGIPKNRQAAVFQAFEQSDASIGGRYGGSGLGLAITKQLVEQQGGRIGLESTEGVGTKVWFELPLVLGQPQAATATHQSATPDQRLKGRQVLVADDEPFNLRLLQTLLDSWGAKATLVKDGREAVERAATQAFDLILLDLRMPRLDGMEACKAIRQGGASMQAPLLVLTASNLPDVDARCRLVGAQGALPKPIDQHLLKERIASLIQGQGRPATSPVPEPLPITEPEPMPEPIPGPMPETQFSLRNLQRMAGSDPQFVQEMVAAFVLAAREAQAKLHQAMAQADPSALAEAAHKLAAPARHIEALTLRSALKELEQKADAAQGPEQLQPIVLEIDRILTELLPALEAAVIPPLHPSPAI